MYRHRHSNIDIPRTLLSYRLPQLVDLRTGKPFIELWIRDMMKLSIGGFYR